MKNDLGPRGGCTLLLLGGLFSIVLGAWAAFGAERPYICTPHQAEAGECLPLIAGSQPSFGTYSDKYLARKKAKDERRDLRRDPRCDGSARYDAMREAYDRMKPNPCDGSKVWVR